MPTPVRIPAVSGAVVVAAALVLAGCGSGSTKPTPPTVTVPPVAPPTATATAPTPSATAQPGVADLSSDAGCNEAMNALLSAGKLPKDDPLKAATGLSAILDKLGAAAAKAKRPGAPEAINAVIGDIRGAIKDGGQNKDADQSKLKTDTANLANVCFG